MQTGPDRTVTKVPCSGNAEWSKPSVNRDTNCGKRVTTDDEGRVHRMIPTHTLNDGATIPAIGFGTYPMRGDEGVAAVVDAVAVGYRLLDTAVNYENESEVGEGIRRCGVAREELFVTSKLPGRHHGYDDAVASTRGSLERLGLDYLDLHLIHWPNPRVGKYPEAWRALVDLQKEGLVRSIGVSNFTEAHLRRVIDETGVTPAVNQIELHPYFPQPEMRRVNADLGILTESWSPLGKRQAPFAEPAVAETADAHGVTPAQVILRWQVQLGCIPIPKSASRDRQALNLDVFGFELSSDEVEAITALGRPDGRLFGGDPDTHEEL
jgi:2,5-diketo-D-gluconate reductase A